MNRPNLTAVTAASPPRRKPSERIAAGMAVEERERPAAEARAAATRFRFGAPPPTAAAPVGPSAAKIAADSIGMSRTTYLCGKKVLLAAKADPDRFGDLVEKLDASANYAGVYNELRRRVASTLPDEADTGAAPILAEEKARHREIRFGILRLLRGALENLSSLPNAGEVAEIVRATARNKKFIDEKLAHSLKWLEEFSREWNRHSD